MSDQTMLQNLGSRTDDRGVTPVTRNTSISAVATLAVAVAFGWAVAGVALGVALLIVHLARIPFALSLRPSPRALVLFFGLTHAIWLASDTWRVFGPAVEPGAVARGPEVLADLGWACFVIIIVWVVHLRGRPRLETWLDSVIWVAALAPPMWLAIIEPASSTPSTFPWVLTWAVLVGLAMFAGGLYVMSGGRWNTPARLLAASCIANTAFGVAVHFSPPADAAQLPQFVPGYVLGIFVALHPEMPDVLRRGGRRTGIPLTARVWMLVPVVALPLLTLEWCFVEARPIPTVAIGVSLVTIASLIAIRAVLLARAGIRDWSTPLTISFTALLVAGVAVSLTLLSQSARVAQVHANQASVAVAAAAAGDFDRARRLVGVTTGEPTAVLIRRSTRELDRRQQVAANRARAVRLFTVATLMATLALVAALLLRFNGARRRMELQYQKTHDELTGLPNRVALNRRIRESRPASGEGARTLVLLDLDDFKAINDSLGHHAGDQVIETVAARLEEGLSSDQILVRLDGDAFALLLPPGQDAPAAAHRMLAALDLPVALPTGPYSVCGSVGIAAITEDDEHRHQAVFRDAELAMYQAKRLSGNSVETFVSDMHERARDRVQLATELREALDTDALHLVYQPIVDLVNGQVVGYEALVRWIHPVRGFLSPADFIPIAEQSGLIIDVGGWVLRTATRQLAAWHLLWDDDRYVSVNVAASQLTTHALGGQVQEALAASGLDPARLLLEVTESSLIEDIDRSVAEMQRVRALGVRFALDDFGTGYSSLSYLRRFPVDVLKVDKAFIDGLHETDGTLLVRAIINMALSLRLRVVAEGIEQPEQAAALQLFGCDLAQGYHFSRPLPAADVPDHPRRYSLPASPALRVLGG